MMLSVGSEFPAISLHKPRCVALLGDLSNNRTKDRRVRCTAAVWPAFSLPKNSQAFFPITRPLMTPSVRLLSIGIAPSSDRKSVV